MAGECGEACNKVKKLRRIAETPESEAVHESRYRDEKSYGDHVEFLAMELADLVTYADLLAARLGIDLGEAVTRKFNRVSHRVNSNLKL